MVNVFYVPGKSTIAKAKHYVVPYVDGTCSSFLHRLSGDP
jgi:hypothetical protein